MAKKLKQHVNAKIEPCFQVGIIITCRALVVDKFGIAWWVDPDSGSISRAD